MFTASVFKIAVISLSGIMDETFAAQEAVRRWNQANAQRTGRLLLAVDDPQAADVLVAVVGNRLDHTQSVTQALDQGRRVLLLFNAFADPTNTIASEQQAVDAFRRTVSPRCYCGQYRSIPELRTLLEQQLSQIQ